MRSFIARELWIAALLAPAAILIAVIVLYPIIWGVNLSLHEARLNRPDLGTGFVGLQHYTQVYQDDIFWLALRNTLVWVAGATALELSLGLVSALALKRPLPGLKIATAIVLLPWFLPNVVVGNMWALLLDPRLGVLNDLLVRMGILSVYKAWFADPSTALATAIVVEAWRGFPFFTLLLMAGLQAIPAQVYEAATIDGANVFQRFAYVTLPMLRTVIATAVILRIITLVSSPELIIILTHGGPGRSTTVLSLYAFETAYRTFDFGYGSALAVILVILLMPIIYFHVRLSGLARAPE